MKLFFILLDGTLNDFFTIEKFEEIVVIYNHPKNKVCLLKSS